MKITKLNINAFGGVHNKEINLDDNINIIYGKNESGKSTILKFILNSFYGAAKTKKGKDISDFEKYKPWMGEEYFGKLEYKLDNGNKFEIYREFNKKNPKIFNENLEDISKEFNIDKNKGNEFFYEQTKIDEELFLSTSAILQQEVKLEKNTQNALIQKISNLVGTGEDNVSYKRAIDRINRRQLEEIGTERSREKPINIVSRRIENIRLERQELEQYVNQKYQIEKEKADLINEIKCNELENEILNKVKKINEKINLEKEKIKIQENIKNEDNEKIIFLKNEIEEIKKENKNKIEKNNEENKIINLKNKKIKNKLNIIFLIIILINIIQFIFIKNKLINYIFLLTVPAYLIFYLIIKNKIKNKKNNINLNLENDELKIKELENEINLIEKNKKIKEEEINKIKNNLNLENNLEKEKIKNNYKNKIENNKLNNLIYSEKTNYLIENLQSIINNNKVKLHLLDLDKENIEPKLDNLAKLEEELETLSEQYVNLKNLNESMEMAKSVLENAYEKMKDAVTPKFTRELSETISKITNGKYNKVSFNDETGLVTEVENGDYMQVDRLSTGTIEQLYLSLRLSILKELSEENIPIILDEAFAFYDDARLKNILNYFYTDFKNNQIIIFTCTDREKNILNELNINYNFINL